MIQQYIDAFNTFVNTASHGEPIVKGMITMWAITVIGVVFRKLPLHIKNFAVHQMTVSARITNEGNKYNRKNFQLLSTWFSDEADVRFARSFMVHSTVHGIKLSPGLGISWFVYKGKLFKVDRIRLDSSGSEIEKEEFLITAFTRKRTIIEDLLNSFAYKESETSDKFFKEWTPSPWDPAWQTYGKQSKRRAINTVVNKDVEKQIFDLIGNFLEKEEWYLERGLPWKKTLILHGEPGTGKTGLIRVIGAKLDMDIHSFNLAMDASQLKEAINALPPKAIMVMEDFDIAKVTEKRAENEDDKKDKTPIDQSTHLYEMLQTLDGLTSLNGTIIIMTTNHFDKIDPAVTRNGRVDGCIEIGKLTSEDVHRYISIVYPDVSYDENIVFEPIKGCDMAATYLKNRDSVDGFIKAVLKNNTVNTLSIGQTLTKNNLKLLTGEKHELIV